MNRALFSAWRRQIVVARAIRPLRWLATTLLVACAAIGLTPVSAGAIPTPDWTATYDVSATPTQWFVNRSQTYTVRVTNDGNRIWTASGPDRVRLGLHFTDTGGCVPHGNWDTDARFDLPNGVNIRPGMTATFAVTVTAPNAVGATILEAQMVKETAFWFGDCADTNVTIAPSDLIASINASATPRTWRFNETKTYNVTVTNIGDQTWNATGANVVRLGMKFTMNSGQWVGPITDQRFFLPHNVAPGATVTIAVTLTSPAPGGWYYPNNIRAEMVKEQVKWYPRIADTPVSVTY